MPVVFEEAEGNNGSSDEDQVVSDEDSQEAGEERQVIKAKEM